MSRATCPFCSIQAEQVFFAGESILGIWDRFPVSPGHALLVTRRHVQDWFDANPTEQLELFQAITAARSAIERRFEPHGFNIGFNVGPVAGQTVYHLHVHVIPRYAGDVKDPRGGVRHVLPATANYLAVPGPTTVPLQANDAESTLVTGGDDPLLPHILEQLDRVEFVDLAVAFVLDSGLRQVEAHLRDFLSRGGRLRLLTGDYLDVTEPSALLRLMDLEGQIELRVFESRGKSFHPKAYLFHGRDGHGTAFVGSSNMSETALRGGVEWNYSVISGRDQAGFSGVLGSFEALFGNPQTVALTHDWIDRYNARRVQLLAQRVEFAPEAPLPPPGPHQVQREALEALVKTRAEGNRAGLVVLATGLGKTWLSAFDSNHVSFKRILFVAHREEILAQARATFRRIRPSAKLGTYMGRSRDTESDVLFASIQTLGRDSHLQVFDPRDFDYIVVDEFHHAAAKTYRRLIDYFRPKFLLGLTATPERTDGGDLLGLCQENLVFRLDFVEGIRRGLLSPFHYFGVPDEVDYTNIPWRSNRFDEEALTNAVATQARAQNALDQYRLRASQRTLSFCCSVRHADFMAEYFRNAGLRAAAVHSGPTSEPRATSLQLLADGALDIIFAVDIFNEGLDLPSIDTVMMLRPTESSILWLQQFGRGLRKIEGKERLTVIDYIGNHRTFLLKPMTLLAQTTDAGISRALDQLGTGDFELPPGCEVTYDLKAIDIIRGLLRTLRPGVETVQLFYEDFREREGLRPTASETFHAGFNPHVVRTAYGSWLRFVEHMGDLGQIERAVLVGLGDFLESLETTPMTKSYKMLVVEALLSRDSFPGELPIADLAEEFSEIAGRSAALRNDIGTPLAEMPRIRQLLERYPIPAWTEGKGTRNERYFDYQNGVFRFVPQVPDAERVALQELTRELIDWRLAEYLSRPQGQEAVVCRVSHSTGGAPLIFLPTDGRRGALPEGWAKISIDKKPYEANFVKVAVNVIRQPGSDKNELSSVLYAWFGPNAGRSGTTHQVAFDRGPEGYSLAPISPGSEAGGAELWKSYMRRDIPGLFGLTFSTGSWQQGLVSTPRGVYLLVTLNKSALNQSAQYKDRFLAPDIFQWESPNSTTQLSTPAQRLFNHQKQGLPVHLFVRRNKLAPSGLAAPFTYCGELQFIEWEHEKPITVRWKLQDAMSERQFKMFDLSTKE